MDDYTVTIKLAFKADSDHAARSVEPAIMAGIRHFVAPVAMSIETVQIDRVLLVRQNK